MSPNADEAYDATYGDTIGVGCRCYVLTPNGFDSGFFNTMEGERERKGVEEKEKGSGKAPG
jgi:hypothetical protein